MYITIYLLLHAWRNYHPQGALHPEDGKLIVKYRIYRKVHLLVLIEFMGLLKPKRLWGNFANNEGCVK